MPRDITDTEMLTWIIDHAHGEHMYINGIGWVPLTREAITEEMRKERGE